MSFKRILLSVIFLFIFLGTSQHVFASAPQSVTQDFYKARVVKIIQQGYLYTNGKKNLFQQIEVKITGGPMNGKTFVIENGGQSTITRDDLVTVGDTIVLAKTSTPHTPPQYVLYDKYRLNILLLIFIAFSVLVLIIAGKKGIGSILGLLISLGIILFYIIPSLLHGQDPLIVSIWGSLAILLITTYLAHGISKQTTSALISTFISLMLTVLLSSLLVHMAGLNGTGDEEAANLQLGATSVINLKGLLLGGIIIGTLGALNDVTTSQAAAIFEFVKMDPSISLKRLFISGFTIGKEHVASMVNTIVLAYAGSSLALFIFFIVNPLKIPYWVILNSEVVSEEIVRTLAGSIGILLVVPIVTLLASLVALYLHLDGLFDKEKIKTAPPSKFKK